MREDKEIESVEDKENEDKDKEEVVMLTTIDNPFNPKEDYIKWKQFDEDKGYNTEEYLARVADIPSEVDTTDEQVVQLYTEIAIEEIVEHNVLGIHKKI